MRGLAFLLVVAFVQGISCLHATAERRVALVIGNAAYEHTQTLRNPVHDATDMTAALKRLGFEVVTALDIRGDRLAETLSEFVGTKLPGADVALFYYAGHGLQFGSRNYLVSIDARLTNEFALEREAFAFDRVLETMETSAKISLLFIDACRNNPLADQLRSNIRASTRAAQVGRGLARLESRSRDTLIVFATAPGKLAEDGPDRNSPFTRGLLNHIEKPGIDVEVMLKDVTSDVRRATGDRQSPERLSRLESKFQFKPAGDQPVQSQPRSADDHRSEERLYWESVKDSKDPQLLRSYLDRYPNGVFATIAKTRISEIETVRSQPAPLDPDRAFDEATSAGTIAAYRKFIDAFPNDARAGRLRQLVREDGLWQRAQSEDTIAAHRNYLAAFPSGIYSALAKARIAAVTVPAQPEIITRSPTPSSEYHYVGRVSPPDPWLALRTEPSDVAGRRIRQMPQGTLLIVLEKRDLWYRVQLQDGTSGWAHGHWIECCMNAQAAATGPMVGGSPSFDCRTDKRDFEQAICADADLSNLDQRLSNTFYRVFARLDGHARTTMRAEQDRWKSQRAACGRNVACLRNLYVTRLRDLER